MHLPAQALRVVQPPGFLPEVAGVAGAALRMIDPIAKVDQRTRRARTGRHRSNRDLLHGDLLPTGAAAAFTYVRPYVVPLPH